MIHKLLDPGNWLKPYKIHKRDENDSAACLFTEINILQKMSPARSRPFDAIHLNQFVEMCHCQPLEAVQRRTRSQAAHLVAAGRVEA